MIAPVFGLFSLILTIAVFVFWIWMLIDSLQNPRLQGTDKLIWVLVVLFLHVLGAAIYYFIGREQRLV
jgi:hypothetical protein